MKLSGWAVETRVYAEDPTRNFLPSIGRLVRYRPPAETSAGGITVRNDTGVYEGGEISLYYDPMIAKLVTHAATRKQAIAAQADALDAFVIEGVRHNIPFLSALMQHKRWQAGKLSTAFLAEEFPGGFHPHRRRGGRAHAGRGRGGDRPRAGRAQAPHIRPAPGPRSRASSGARCGSATSEIAARYRADGSRSLVVRFAGRRQALRAGVGLEARRSRVVGHDRRPAGFGAGAAGAQRLR